jgi:hypothetical protein
MHKKRNGELSFPSHMGYGYHGDNKKDRYKPAINLHSTHDFKPESVYKKQTETQTTVVKLPLEPVSKDSTPKQPILVKNPTQNIKQNDTLK